jgi:hypothetical protein
LEGLVSAVIIKIGGISVEWDGRFDDVSGAFLGWFPREGSPLREGFSVIHLRSTTRASGWYLRGPDGVADRLEPQPPASSTPATLEAATRRALEICRMETGLRDSHVLFVTYTINDDGLHVSCSCGAFESRVGFGPSLDELVQIQNEHRSRTTT